MTDPKREILKELDDKDTRYAILSHRWGVEVGYEEMTGLMKMGEEQREEVRERYGYQKIIKSCEQAKKDGYEWLWVDTCCIDKRSSSELSEAINSMYRWYRNAQVCYAYLNDVDKEVFPVKQDGKKFDKSNGWPEWFELIAPRQVEFFNRDWVSIGNKRRLALALEEITKIPPKVVRDGLAAKRPSVAQIMSWAADRKTTRVEDRAYSLMGLQLEIIPHSPAITAIFAWDPQSPRTGTTFGASGNTRKVEPGEFVDSLARYICGSRLGDPFHWGRLAWLRWRARSLSQPLRTFSVSNAGIQVCLPVIPSPNSPSHFSALLACSDRTFLERIDLVFSGSSFDRTSRTTNIPTAYPEFKTLYLTHSQDANETHREFTLDDKHASYHGFTRRGTFPRKFPGRYYDLIVIVYANDDVKSRFCSCLGYYLGQGWVHVHAHLPRSIWVVMVVWGRWKMDDFDIMVDVEQCPGCCDGPCKWEMTRALEHDLDTPGLMLAGLDGCSGQAGLQLGDYGDYSDDIFTITNCLVLRQPKGLSLPTNECVVLLLKALSHRAAGNICGNHSTEPQVLTLLYAAASPQVWRRKPIREHFYSLMNMDQFRRPEARRKSLTIFGLPYLRNYVANNIFFERLSSMMETNSRNEVSVAMWKRCPILVWPDASRRYASEKQKVTHELESISRTPSAGILWFCWCGIRAEVDELLSKVVHYIRMVQYPWGLGKAIESAMPSLTDPDDDP
ncbi:heterokaryon incompatibility protein-domain-containing protein, partial [Pisolithus tinctorius]